MIKKKNLSSFFKNLTTAFLIVIILSGFVGVLFYISGGYEEFKTTFYINYGNIKYKQNSTNLVLEKGSENKFEIIYFLEDILEKETEASDKIKDYSVQIFRQKDCDFEFTVDGFLYDFAGEKDLTSAFDIEKFDSYFLLNIDSDLNFNKILSKVNNGGYVLVSDEIDIPSDWFTMVISDENYSINIDFSIKQEVTGVKLNKELTV